MLTKRKLTSILKDISYKPSWNFKVEKKGAGFVLRTIFTCFDAESGQMDVLEGNQWYLNPKLSVKVVVETAYAAIAMEEDMSRIKSFLYKGKRL